MGKSKESVVAESAETTTSTRAVYELTAMVAHVHDEFDKGKLFQEESEGHLVAHIKVKTLTAYVNILNFMTLSL